jgi:putative lipoprotein
MLMPMDPELLTGRVWEVVDIAGEPVELERLPSIEFNENGRVAGSTGVNRLMGSYELTGSTLRLSQLATTMMAGQPEAMRTEARLVQALGGGGEVELHIVIINPDTGETVRMRAMPAEPPTAEADAAEEEASPVQPRARNGDGTLRGSVTFRDPVAIPVGAVVMVRLLDTSRADAPAEVIGQQVIREASEVPVAFEIGYDPASIDESHAYAAAAQIVVDGRVAWHSTMQHPVLTRGAGDSATIMVARVSR